MHSYYGRYMPDGSASPGFNPSNETFNTLHISSSFLLFLLSSSSGRQGAVLAIGTVVAPIKDNFETAKVVFLRDLRRPVHRSLWLLSE